MIRDTPHDCPRCGSRKMKAWTDLDADEKLLAEKLPMSAEYTCDERKKHRFCTRCWFEKERPEPHDV